MHQDIPGRTRALCSSLFLGGDLEDILVRCKVMEAISMKARWVSVVSHHPELQARDSRRLDHEAQAAAEAQGGSLQGHATVSRGRPGALHRSGFAFYTALILGCDDGEL